MHLGQQLDGRRRILRSSIQPQQHHPMLLPALQKSTGGCGTSSPAWTACCPTSTSPLAPWRCSARVGGQRWAAGGAGGRVAWLTVIVGHWAGIWRLPKPGVCLQLWRHVTTAPRLIAGMPGLLTHPLPVPPAGGASPVSASRLMAASWHLRSNPQPGAAVFSLPEACATEAAKHCLPLECACCLQAPLLDWESPAGPTDYATHVLPPSLSPSPPDYRPLGTRSAS